MFHALYTAASGMTAQQINLDNIANNLANSSTSGFQSRRVQFSDLLYQSSVMPGAAATQQTTVASGLQIGLGTRPGNTEIVQTQGDLASTGNPLDFAIPHRIVPAGRAGQLGHRERRRASAGDQHSLLGNQYYRWQRRHGERNAAWPDSSAAGRCDSTRDVPESWRPE